MREDLLQKEFPVEEFIWYLKPSARGRQGERRK